MVNKRKQGSKAEQKVIEYLLKKDYQFLEKNFIIAGGEIDIIARQAEQYVFVEVKSLSNEKYIELSQSITQKKRKVLKKTCEIWLKRKKLENVDWRIDFIGIIMDRDQQVKKLIHFEAAIY